MDFNWFGGSYKTIVISNKGGVGKSTVSVNIAKALVKYKKIPVGLIDADITSSSIVCALNIPLTPLKIGKKLIEPYQYDGMKVIATSLITLDENIPVYFKGEKIRKLINQYINHINWSGVKHFVFDLPPGQTDELIEIMNSFKTIHNIILVTTPDKLALNSIRKTVSLFEKNEMKITGVVLNMCGFKCKHCNKLNMLEKSVSHIKEYFDNKRIPILAEIPFDYDVHSDIYKYIDKYEFVIDRMRC